MLKKIVLFGLVVLLLVSCATSTKPATEEISVDEIIIEEPVDILEESSPELSSEEIPELIEELEIVESVETIEAEPVENVVDSVESVENTVESVESVENENIFSETPINEFVAQPTGEILAVEPEVIETVPLEAKTPEPLQNEAFIKYYFIDGKSYSLSYYPGRAYISIPEDIPTEQVDWVLVSLGEKFGSELAGITYEIKNRVVFITISDSWTESALLEMESKLEAEIMAITGEVQSNEIMTDGEMTFEILDKEPEELSQEEISSIVSEFVTEQPIVEEPVIVTEEPVETIDYNIDWQSDPIYAPQETVEEVVQEASVVENTTVKLEDPVEILLENEEEVIQAVEDYKNVIDNNKTEHSTEDVISSILTDPLFKKILGYVCVAAVFITILISAFFKKGNKKRK
jgi:hypothetical protein